MATPVPSRFQFNFPPPPKVGEQDGKLVLAWIQAFEQEFSLFLNRLNKKSDDIYISQHNPRSKFHALPNGGFEVIVDGVQKELWSP